MEFLKSYAHIILIILVIVLFVYKKPATKIIGKVLDSKNQIDCPSKIIGNASSYIRIKYFESPYCPACWKEEVFAFPRLFKRENSSFFMEKYDIRFCRNETKRYDVIGTPTFVFQNTNGSKEFVHYGYQSYRELSNMIYNTRRLK